jgi:hypothetical protein
MTLNLMLTSENAKLLRLVRDFARGLGCEVEAADGAEGPRLQANVPDGEILLELLSYIALSATNAGVDIAEPLCRVTYRHPSAASMVTFALRIADFGIDPAAV